MNSDEEKMKAIWVQLEDGTTEFFKNDFDIYVMDLWEMRGIRGTTISGDDVFIPLKQIAKITFKHGNQT